MRQTIFISVALLIVLTLVSCRPIAVATPQATAIPKTLPATWTPTSGPTAIPTFTEIPTFTLVPPIAPPPSPTSDPLGPLRERFQDSLYAPVGLWVAYRDPKKLRVVDTETNHVWTIPCTLFKECSTVYPIKWSRGGQVLYFAAAPTVGGAPNGISLVTALGKIEVKSGKWDILLPYSGRYYDFAFSPDDDYIAYTQSSGKTAEEPSVSVGILRIKNKKVQHEFTLLNEMYAGNIVWSPFKYRIVFQARNAETGSSILFYDIDKDVVKYILSGKQSDFILSNWNDADNSVMLEEKNWLTSKRSYWFLNPFTGDLTSASITATPAE